MYPISRSPLPTRKLSPVCADGSKASPFALELAAVRLQVLSLEELAERLDDRFQLLREHDAQIRFRMLDTIREYGQARLAEAGEGGDLALRHRNWFAELVAVATREWAGPRQVEWAARLHLDHPNIRLALEYSMARPAEMGIGIGIAAQPWFWASMDHLNEARMWLDRGPRPPRVRPNVPRW
ncbi:hypothetical protein ACF06X_06840 [Streptomyces sp. NPDC015346]|uniref:hypothetical protein n=1 Tax=Streptomyces sp. NPDC015346 TaxID=3364954 RepID=UPI0036F6BC76